MGELTLKRGWGTVFTGENWMLAGSNKWIEQDLYVANGMESYMGQRDINGVRFAVFRCLDDDFMAQPVITCELAKSEDPLEIQSITPFESTD